MAVVSDIEIRLRADIARLQQDMNGARRTVDNAMGDIRSAANAAKTALAGIAAGIGFGQIARLTDEYAKFTAQLRLASVSQREYAAAYADVKRIASQSTQGLGETGVLYARIANGTRELGVAQKQVAAITETVNLSLLVSGATANEAASAQLQLSQAFASGTLRGEEFNAVNEAAPRLMLALADGIGVPVGQLKKMAEEGMITSKIMADVLPNALEKLREEAKQVQTISGAFTVLRNSVMEFVGAQAQANGVAGSLSTVLRVLADNLNAVVTAMLALAAVKLVNWLNKMVTDTLAAAAANRTLQASTLANAVATTQAAAAAATAKAAEAAANTRAAASALAVANARMAELRASVLAAEGATALAITTNGLIPAQARAAAMAQAHAASLSQLAAAQTAAAGATAAHTAASAAQAGVVTMGARAAGVMRGALGLLGGPIGIVVTLLGLGATAWALWGNKAKEGNDLAQKSVEETTPEMIARIQQQIDKLKERNRLAEKVPVIAGVPEVDMQGLQRAKQDLDDAIAGTGRFAGRSEKGRELAIKNLRQYYNDAQEIIKTRAAEVAKEAKRTEGARVAEWLGMHGSANQRMQHEMEETRKKVGTLTPEMEKLIAAKYSDAKATKEQKNQIIQHGNAEDMKAAQDKYAAEQIEIRRNAMTELGRAHDDYSKGLERVAGIHADELEKARKEAETQEDLANAFGKTASEISALEIARIEEQLAQKYSLGLTLDEIDYLEELLVLKKRNASAREGLDDMKARADEWKDFEQTARDTFRSIEDGSKDAAQRIKETFKNVFFDWLYQMTLKQWIIQLKPVSAGGGGLMDAAGKAFSDSGGGLTGAVQAGKMMLQTFSSGFSTSLGTSIAKLGQTLGSKAVSSFGLGMTGASSSSVAAAGGSAGAAGAGSSVASAIPLVGAIVAGMMANNKFFKDGWRLDAKDIMSSQMSSMLKGNGFAPLVTVMTASMNVFEKAMKGLGVNSKFASMLSGSSVFARAFGRKQATVESQGFEGTLSSSGFDGRAFAEMFSKGGWFRSDKRETVRSALDSSQDKAFDNTIKSVADSVRSMGAVLGLEASRIDGYSKQIKLTLGKDEAENQKLIEAAFGGLADDLSALMLPNLAELAQGGETASKTLQRVAGNFQMVNAALDVLNTTSEKAFGAVGAASLAARERLVELVGGVDELASQTSFFAQNFMSEAERLAPAQRLVTEQLAALGKSGITTADDFKAAVLDLTTGGKLATEEGAKTYAGLLSIAPAFKLITDASTAAAQKLTDKAAELAQAAADERQSLQDELDGLTMTSAQLLNKQRDALYESNRGLFDHIQAIKASNAAIITAAQTIAATIAAAKVTADDLVTGADNAFTVLQGVAAREREIATDAHNATMARLQIEINAQTEALTKHKALSDAIQATLGSMKGGGNAGLERGAAQAQLKMALTMARAGAMPLVETLKDAFDVLSRDSSDMFDSLEDYQRDFYRTQNDLIALGNLSDAALSVEEKTLRALQRQQGMAEEAHKQTLGRIDSAVTIAQQQLETLKGVNTNGITLVDAMNALRLAIINAQENALASSAAKINQAYKDSLARAPDAAGMEFWKDRIASGVDTQVVVDAIKNSQEAQIQGVYKDLLGRNADAGGLDFFMKSGATIEAIRAAILQSPEYQNRAPVVYSAQQSGTMGGSNGAMLTELQTLNSRMENVEVAMSNTARNTGQLATQFDEASGGGAGLYVLQEEFTPV